MTRLVLILGVVLAIAAAGCGGGSAGSSGGSGAPGASASGGTLNVFAAASLTEPFTTLAKTYEQQNPGWKVNLNFAGSDELAAQIEQGAPADVYAAASTTYPEQLQGEKLLGPTTDFATNTLVLVVPPSNPAHITAVRDLTKGAKLVVGDDAVPVGAYTETVLDKLKMPESSLNVVSKEQDVKAVLSKVELGEADAGFVYITDAHSAGGKVKRITLPAAAQATATYPIGVVSASKEKEAAQRWIELVTGPAGQQELTSLEFGPAPSG